MSDRRAQRVPALVAVVCLYALSASGTLLAQSSVKEIPIAVPAATDDLRGASPAVRFGTAALELSGVVAVLPLRAGGVVLADGGSQRLLFFDPSGRLVRAVGGPGAGPGEYQDIGGVVALRRDSILVWDRLLRRATVLTPTGDYARAFLLAAPFDGGGRVMRVVSLADGSLLIGFADAGTWQPSPVAIQLGERLLRYGTDGKRLGTTDVHLLGSERFVQAVPPEFGGVAYWNLAFGRELSVRPFRDGVATGDGTSWSVDVRSLADGAVRLRLALARESSRLSPTDIATFRAAALRSEKGAGRVLAERMLAEMPFPKTQPAYIRFEVDDQSALWIEDYVGRRGDAKLWYRLDAETATAEATRFPVRFSPFAFAHGMVYGVWRDEDDVESVIAYRVRAAR